jgi:hypothetical protein
VSDEVIKLKTLLPVVLQALTVSQLRLDLAQANHARMMAEVERDFDFRFKDVDIDPDGVCRPKKV